MESHAVAEASHSRPAAISSSQHSHSSSPGSFQGASASKKENPQNLSSRNTSRGSGGQGTPEAAFSPERAPRPSFLKSSFGQRLSAQYGSIFLDNNSHRQDDARQPLAGCARAAVGNLEIGASPEQNLRLGASSGIGGTSHSASGRGSSGLSEVDAKGMTVTAAEALGARPPGTSGGQVLKLWGFVPAALPKQRAMAMVGHVAAEKANLGLNNQQTPFTGRVPAELKRDGSPLGQARRTVSSNSLPVQQVDSQKAGGRISKLELEEARKDVADFSTSNLELEEARKDMMAASALGSGRLSQKSLFNDRSNPQAQSITEVHGYAEPVLTRETSMPRDGGLNSCNVEDLQVDRIAATPLSTAAESDAPTSELGAGVPSTTKRPSFKNDCGFLKLLPSKRKFSLEDQEGASPLRKSGGNNSNAYVLPGDRNVESEGVLRLSSNSSSGNMVSRKSLAVHFAEKPKSVTNEQSSMQLNRDSSVGKDRRTCSDQFHAMGGGKPVVGSFMKWMIDVGKGLAKKRCFGSIPAAPPASQSAEASPLSSPIAGICTATGGVAGGHKASCNSNIASRMCDSSKPSEDGRLFSPQSCQNMDTEDQNGITVSQKQSSPAAEEACNNSEMHISGDEQQVQQQGTDAKEFKQQEQAHHTLEEDNGLRQFSPDSMNKTEQSPAEASGDANEGNNSQNATEGTTRSAAPTDQHKDATALVSNNLQQDLQSTPLEEQQQQQQQKRSPGNDEQGPAASENVKSGGEEASFGMWTASCLVGQEKSSSRVIESSQKHLKAPINRNHLASGIVHPLDGSGEPDCPQGMAEFVASMASVKNWVQKGVKCRENGHSNSDSSSRLKRPCSFCGLKGHTVIDCSETLDCELKELERRSLMLEEMRVELRDLPCLRCLGMGHLGAQCRFSVTEATSRARENSELRNWKFTRRNGGKQATESSLLFHQTAGGHETTTAPPVLWTQNTNIVTTAPLLSAELEKKVGNGKHHSPCENVKSVKEKKHEESPKENLYRRIGFQNSLASKEKTMGDPSKRKNMQAEALPPVPKGLLVAIESVRLSRSELWRWVDSPDFSTHVRGFFLRLRFGRWEKDLGGTGYRMARIRGAISKNGAEEKNMSVSVDLGDMECTVDSQYVSNHPFTEAELVEWWRGRWKAGKRLINEAELQIKMAQRQDW